MFSSTKWVRRQRRRLIESFGGCCWACKTKKNLEFAHKRPTNVKGLGRGSYVRVIDVVKNPKCYVLLCKRCHRRYDAGEIQVD